MLYSPPDPYPTPCQISLPRLLMIARIIATAVLAPLAVLSLSASSAQAATASSGALGYTTVTCLWESDTLCSAAGVTEKPDFVGKLNGVPSGSTIQVSGSPAWADDQFNDTHYVRFVTGVKGGRYYPVTDTLNGNELVLDLGGDSLSGVVATDSVKLVKFWTLGTLFPLATQDTIIESANNLGFNRNTEILFPDLTTEGVDLSASSKYFLVTGVGWRDADMLAGADDVIVLPDMYFIVRHRAAPVGTPGGVLGTTFVPMGTVEEGATTIPLSTLDANGGGGSQDNAVAISRPVAVALKDSDLISSGAFLGSLNNFGFNRRDELLVFDLDVDTIDPEDSGVDRSSVAKYFYNTTAGTWIDADTLANANDTKVFQPGSGVLIRKYEVSGGVTSFWKFDPND